MTPVLYNPDGSSPPGWLRRLLDNERMNATRIIAAVTALIYAIVAVVAFFVADVDPVPLVALWTTLSGVSLVLLEALRAVLWAPATVRKTYDS